MRVLWFAVLLLSGLAGCAVDEDVVAEVGTRQVKVDAVQSYLEAVTESRWQDVDDKVAGRLVDQYLDQEVVAEAVGGASELALADKPGDRSAMIRTLLQEACGEAPAVSEADVEEAVKREAEVSVPKRARVRQLLLDDEESARSACERLAAGEDFLELSRHISRAPNAASGGGLGVLEEGGLPDPLDHVIFALGAGEVSAPVEGPSGYHVFQVLEVIPAGAPDRRELEGRLRRGLRDQAMRRFVSECVRELAAEVGVEVHGDHLWFPYHGRYSKKGA